MRGFLYCAPPTDDVQTRKTTRALNRLDEIMNHPYTPSPEHPTQCAICGSTDLLAHTWARTSQDGTRTVGNGTAPD